MTNAERKGNMLQFEDPVKMMVLHPRYGKLEVKAYCAVDAKMQAGAAWGETDWSKMRVAVETKALQQTGKEGMCHEGP